MKIIHVEAFYPQYSPRPPAWRSHLWQIAVRVETDQGLVGWGAGGGGLASVVVVNHHLGPLLSGRSLTSPQEITACWEDLYAASIPYGRKGIAIMALSGIDLALWDLLGKAEGVPVCQLLTSNEPKRRIRAYATGADAAWYAELGYTAHKFSHRWTGDEREIDDAVNTAEKARALLGPEALLMVDSYMSWDVPTTRRMADALREQNIYWFEDVLTPDRLTEQAMLRGELGAIHLAGGEHEFTHFGFEEIAKANALDIWQPDITWCGGLTAGLRITAQAAAHGVRVIPHRGGEVWGLHLIAATDCDNLAEVLPGQRDKPAKSIWLDEPMPKDGYLTIPDLPGFGVAPDVPAVFG